MLATPWFFYKNSSILFTKGAVFDIITVFEVNISGRQKRLL